MRQVTRTDGPFELLVDRARHCAEVGNTAEWETIDDYGTLVAWQTGSRRGQTEAPNARAAQYHS